MMALCSRVQVEESTLPVTYELPTSRPCRLHHVYGHGARLGIFPRRTLRTVDGHAGASICGLRRLCCTALPIYSPASEPFHLAASKAALMASQLAFASPNSILVLGA